MVQSNHSSHKTGRSTKPLWLLVVASMSLVAAVACGSDDGGQGQSNGVAAASFQASEDSITWAPPWDNGDTRSITVAVRERFSRLNNRTGVETLTEVALLSVRIT